MKAMVLKSYKKPLTLEDVEKPTCGSEEVLLKVKAAGVCGTDVKIQQGMVPTKDLPLIPGHEIAGVIAEVGCNVQKFKVGDEVLVSFYIPCNICRSCWANRQTICENLTGRLGFELNGGFAEYVSVPEECLLHKPDNITFQQAAIISDAIATCYHALVRRASAQRGDNIVMIGGGGGLGLHGIQIARNLGANVIGVDISEDKLELMKKMGAHEVIDGRDRLWIEKIDKYTRGRGADKAVVYACTDEIIAGGIDSLRKGGKLILISYAPEVTFNGVKTHLNEIDIINTRAATKDDIEKCLQLITADKVKPVVDTVLNLEDINIGLELIKNGNLKGRLVVNVE